MRIVFWQDILSFHQSPHIRSLSRQNHDVTLVVEQPLSPQRLAMGWHVPDFGATHIVVAPSPAQVRDIIVNSEPQTVHIIGSVRGYRIGRLALRACLQGDARVGLLTESGDPRGIKGWLRRLLYSTERHRHGRHLDFILAMGQLGVNWFTSCSYPPTMVFPSAYTTETPDFLSLKMRSKDKTSFLYVGQCIVRKGVDLALRSLHRIDPHLWELTIVGEGPEKQNWKVLTRQLKLEKNVHFLPYSSNECVHRLMAQADVLLLPSRFDGWGAVVNEALLLGTPVICSDLCGAADLLSHCELGRTFKAGSVQSLTLTLQNYLTEYRTQHADSGAIARWARERISGEVVAQYLGEVLSHVYNTTPRPTAPWRL